MEEQNRELLLPLVEEENICLPLPINVVSRYWNVRLPMAEAEETAKRYSGFGGSIMIDGIESAERHGLSCRIARSSLPGLREAIDAGIPPIVILPGIPEITQHASVITGYDAGERTIFHYIQKGTKDGEQQEGAIPEDVFDGEWAQEGRMMILLAPGETLSQTGLQDDAGARSNRLCFAAERDAALKDTEQALRSLREAAELDPDNPNALYLLGAVLNDRNSPECAQFYERCLEINKRSYLAHSGLGNFYLKTERFGEAEEHYTRAIGIDAGRSAKIYKNRAYVRDRLGRGPGARDDLQSYLRYFPRAPDRGAIERAIREL